MSSLLRLAPLLLLAPLAAVDARSAGGDSQTVLAALPGADSFGAELVAELRTARAKRGKAYVPRTRHRLEDGSARYTNRLFLESSPYLLQHAHNPVNWYPWGDEAFEAAERLDRPVLVSIGYSTCHWCHVMEEESFEDEEIARYLNAHYVAIKVDREERPDVDGVYMTALQAMTGSGGWPLNVWLTPDRKPFFGGTYFPARDGDRGASVGFLTVLRSIHGAYDRDRETVARASRELSELLQQVLARPGGGDLPKARVLHAALAFYRDNYDYTHGGLSGAPKFPSSLPVRLLLRYHRRSGDSDVLDMAVHTLEQMAAGGIHDHDGDRLRVRTRSLRAADQQPRAVRPADP